MASTDVAALSSQDATPSATVADMFPVTQSERRQYVKLAHKAVAKLVTLDPESPEFDAELAQIREIGRDEVTQSSEALESLLSRNMIPLDGRLDSFDAPNAGLESLRTAVENLDPSGKPRSLKTRLYRHLSRTEFGRDLFDTIFPSYGTPADQIRGIAEALKSSRETLTADLDLAKVEMQRLWDDLAALGALDAQFQELNSALSDKVRELRPGNSSSRHADALESRALVAVNTRQQDVATHAAVILNSYMTLRVLTETGTQLAENVYYAENTSLNALRLVAASDVIANAQQAVASQVDSVRNVTSEMLVKSASKLRDHSENVNDQARHASVQTEKLADALRTTYAAIETATKSGATANIQIREQVEKLNSTLGEYKDKGFGKKAH